MNIGYNLKTTRKIYKISQKQLAKETGITQQAISFWERNERTPNIVDLIKLADYYQISLDELVGRDYYK